MTTLSKDWRRVVLDLATAMSLPTQATVTSATYTAFAAGHSASIPKVQNYPESAANVGPVGIRLATTAEVQALRDYLYPGASTSAQASMVDQLLSSGDFGKPLMVMVNRTYLATWYGDFGIGFYVFVGYDPDNHPTQDVVLTR